MVSTSNTESEDEFDSGKNIDDNDDLSIAGEENEDVEEI